MTFEHNNNNLKTKKGKNGTDIEYWLHFIL